MTKIAFFGTSDRSIPILESLKQNFNLVLCVTREDVLIGRHQTAKKTGVKKWAEDNGVTYITIKESLKEEAGGIIEQIKASKAEFAVVADFGFIIPQKILDIFPKRMMNIHFSLLPKYRGASPVQFAILNRDSKTGITFQLMEYGLDTGPIIDTVTYELNGTETSGELYRNLFGLSAQKLPQVVQKYLDGALKPQTQDESQASYTRSPSHPNRTFIYKEDARIDWNRPVKEIEAGIRTYSPWPIAWTTLTDMQDSAGKIAGFTKLKDPGNVLKTVKIHQANVTASKIAISNIQVEGGKVLSWDQFCNGYLILH